MTVDGYEIIISQDGNITTGNKNKKLVWTKISDQEFSNSEVIVRIGDMIKYNPTEGLTEKIEPYNSPSNKTGYTDNQEFILTGNNASYDLDKYGWQVLGINENNQLLIISENLIHPSNLNNYNLTGSTGLKNAITELNNICNLYAKGYGAISGRSVTVEDINKITGYNPNNVGVFDPNQTGRGNPYKKDTLYEYGNEISYYWDGTETPYYKTSNQLTGKLSKSHSSLGFWWFSNNSLNKIDFLASATPENKSLITQLKMDHYSYYVTTLTDSWSDVKPDGAISKDSEIYKMFDIY